MIKKHQKNGTSYWVYNDKPKLPVIIMIHGFRGTHHGLGLIAENLNEYKIIVPDLPGFGESKPLDVNHSVENYVKWLHKFIDELNLNKKPILLGHSFGSIISSFYASQYPDTISKLILINPIGSPALEGPRALLTRLTTLYFWLGEKLPEKIALKLLSNQPAVMIVSNVMTKTKDKAIRKYVRQQHSFYFSSFTNRQVVCEAYKASISNTVRDVAPKINLDTLLIVGEFDDITTLKKQQELQKMFSNAKLEVISNVGHLIHYETPKEAAGLIKSFLISD